jgi:bifunctional dethiobiotin synthetase / adenosylmethionine---8-amino-7-oxononanoate aminotransferase
VCVRGSLSLSLCLCVCIGTLQSDLYRPLRLPTVLIGDAQLGGISTTLAAHESLYVRGYDVVAVLMFANARLRNHEAIQVRGGAGAQVRAGSG